MDSQLVRNKLLEKASLPTGDDLSAKQDVFNDIMQILQEIQTGKAELYGDYFERLKEHTSSMNILRNFIEIEKKYIRAKNILGKEGSEAEIANLLLDTYADLAIYSMMGIGVLGQIITEDNEK